MGNLSHFVGTVGFWVVSANGHPQYLASVVREHGTHIREWPAGMPTWFASTWMEMASTTLRVILALLHTSLVPGQKW